MLVSYRPLALLEREQKGRSYGKYAAAQAGVRHRCRAHRCEHETPSLRSVRRTKSPGAPRHCAARDTPSPRRIDRAQVELLFKDPEGYKLARDEYNRKMKEEIMEEGAPDRAFLLQAAAVGLGSFLFGLYGPKRKDD